MRNGLIQFLGEKSGLETMADNKIAYAYIDAWNRHDVDEITGFFHEQAVYIDTTLDEELTGDQIKRHIEWIIDICQGMRFEIVDCTRTMKNSGAIEWLMYGQNRDPFYAGAPLSEEEPILGVDFLRFIDDKIISTHVYFDHKRRKRDVEMDLGNSEELQKYQKSGLTEQDLLRYQRELEVLMKQEKKYLESDLTLSKLANYLNISTNHVSQVINGKFEKNFHDFVNHYRIDAAILLMNDENSPAKSPLEIAFEVGFGSSSGFYHAFKKITGLTPTQLKKSRSEQ